MVVALALKKYIYRCDLVLANNDYTEAKVLEKEIVDDLRNYVKGITQGLEWYDLEKKSPDSAVNFIADIGLLRERLQKELKFF